MRKHLEDSDLASVSASLSKEELAELEREAKRRGEPLSVVIREVAVKAIDDLLSRLDSGDLSDE